MLFTFPSRYWFAIGLLRVFSLGGWSRRIHTGFLVSRATQGTATLRMTSCTGRSPAMARCSNLFHSPCFLRSRGPTTPCVPEHAWFGLFPVRSPLLGESLLFSLPAGTKMFQFPAFACRISGMTGLQPAGLSHSEILGSKVICTSPGLFAAYHVLLRLQEPRHPPYALSYLFAAPRCRGRCLLKVVLKRLPLLLNKFARILY